MKYSRLSLLFLAAVFFMGCGSAPQIVHKDYIYEKILFGTQRINFDIHLENIGNSGKIYELINNLIYNHKNFDEYVEYREKDFIGDPNEAAYPPMIDEDGTEYFYHSDLIEKYAIIFNSNTHIIFEKNVYLYDGGAHGNYGIRYFIIDIKEEKILDIDDLMYPIPDGLLKEIIEANYTIHYYLRENIWPPDTVNFYNKNITLIWNTYAITPYSNGIIQIDIPDEIIEPYLTDKGKVLKKLTIKEINNR